jgi:hypothetical protein
VKILKNKKGFAMETAIWFMLLISALCFLMTSVAIYGHYQTKFEQSELWQEALIDQIGEDYLASIKAGKACDSAYGFQADSHITNGGYYGGGQYCYSLQDNVFRVWRAGDRNKKIILYVESSESNGEIVVNAWRYSEP